MTPAGNTSRTTTCSVPATPLLPTMKVYCNPPVHRSPALFDGQERAHTGSG